MPTYKIVIKDETGQSISSKTKPALFDASKDKKTSNSNKGGFNAQSLIRGINTLGNPDSLLTMGFSAITKAIPYVAVASAVITTGVSVQKKVANIKSMKSGNYAYQVKYSNTMNKLKRAMTPFTTLYNDYTENLQIQLENERKAMRTELLGDSIINSYGKGKGV